MLPLGHAAFAYLSHVGVAATFRRRLPPRLTLVPVVAASQLPDLIDKPLVYFGVVSSGRSFGHSLLALGLLSLAVLGLRALLVARISVPPLRKLLAVSPVPFTVGYASHLIGDSYRALLAGHYRGASYLLWPLLPPPVYPNDDIPPWVRLMRIYQAPQNHDKLSLIGLALVVFISIQIRRYWLRSATRR